MPASGYARARRRRRFPSIACQFCRPRPRQHRRPKSSRSADSQPTKRAEADPSPKLKLPARWPPSIADLTEGMGGTESLSYGDCPRLPPAIRRCREGPCGVRGRFSGGDEPASHYRRAKRRTAVPKSRFGEILATTQEHVFRDYANYYTLDTLGEVRRDPRPGRGICQFRLRCRRRQLVPAAHPLRRHQPRRLVLPAAGKRLLHDTGLCFRQVPGRILRRPARHAALGRIRRSHHAGITGGRLRPCWPCNT